MSRENRGQASYNRPYRRTQDSDHRCNDEFERPQIVRGWIFRGISSNPCEYRSGHSSTYRKNDRQDTGFTNCAGSSGKNTDYNQTHTVQGVRQGDFRVGDLPVRITYGEEANHEGSDQPERSTTRDAISHACFQRMHQSVP